MTGSDQQAKFTLWAIGISRAPGCCGVFPNRTDRNSDAIVFHPVKAWLASQ
ncbi:hypothetical protein SAMN05216359_104256 [Roseateles sp. YR242]|nr:hypothetical protein SAMN05216359_104256 [Roseateles sp. YR242]